MRRSERDRNAPDSTNSAVWELGRRRERKVRFSSELQIDREAVGVTEVEVERNERVVEADALGAVARADREVAGRVVDAPAGAHRTAAHGRELGADHAEAGAALGEAALE